MSFFSPQPQTREKYLLKGCCSKIQFLPILHQKLAHILYYFFLFLSFLSPVSQKRMRTDKHHALICLSMSIHGGPQGRRCPAGVADGTAHKEHLSISLVKHDRHYKELLVDFFFLVSLFFPPKITSTRVLFCFIVFWSASMCRNTHLGLIGHLSGSPGGLFYNSPGCLLRSR